jgi:osmotically-inducible protein OsmY
MMWTYPNDRYYYPWYDESLDDEAQALPTDRDVKSTIVDRLRENPYTKDCDLTVDVNKHVVILSGEVESSRAKRAAGDDCWDTRGVLDVSNQLTVVGGS